MQPEQSAQDSSQSQSVQNLLWKGKKPTNLHNCKPRDILQISKPFPHTRNKVNSIKDHPYCCIGLVTAFFQNDKTEYCGSGCLIGPKTVLTCAHNVYNHEKKKTATKIFFYPRLNGNDGEKFHAQEFYYPLQFQYKTTEEKSSYDICLMKLKYNLENEYGFVGIDAINDTEKETKIQISGYPGDKNNQIWSGKGKVEKLTPFLFYKIATQRGNSGSPIFKEVNGEKVIIGVHLAWSPEEKMNKGIMLNRKTLNQWLKVTMAKLSDVKFAGLGEVKEIITKQYSNGRYEGEMKMHGQGTYYWKNGNRYEGNWKDDKMHGQGTYYWKNGNRYEGNWKDDKMHGQGTYYYLKGRYEIGNYKDGLQEGKSILFSKENVAITEKIYEKGIVIQTISFID